MSLLSREDIENIIKRVKDQVENEKIMYEDRIINSVQDIFIDQELATIDIKPENYAKQWMIINIPRIQSDRSAMESHHGKIMTEKFEYYNRTNNFDGLITWVSSLLRNIGFTDSQANRLLTLIIKIGELLYKKVNAQK